MGSESSTDSSGSGCGVPRPPPGSPPVTVTSLAGLSVSRYARAGTLLLLLGCFLHGLALSLPVWENDHGDSWSSLWLVCLGSRCISTLQIGMKVWFHAVQILMVTCALTLLAALISVGVHIFYPSLEKQKKRTATATFCIILAAGVQSFIAVIVYCFGQVPYPDYFYTLSWGFYMALVGTFFMLASAILYYKETHRLSFRAIDKRPILRHSSSVTSEMCFSLTPTPRECAQRTRSESEVRLRAPSFTTPTSPYPPDDTGMGTSPGSPGAGLRFITED